MYYEEKMINRVLSYRNTPHGEWIKFSQEKLSEKLMKARYENSIIQSNLDHERSYSDVDKFNDWRNGLSMGMK